MLLDPNQLPPQQRTMIVAAAQPLSAKLHTIHAPGAEAVDQPRHHFGRYAHHRRRAARIAVRPSMMPIDAALRDARLLGAGLGDPTTWSTWLTTLCASAGLPLNEQQAQIFATIAGGRKPPQRRVRESWYSSAAVAVSPASITPLAFLKRRRRCAEKSCPRLQARSA